MCVEEVSKCAETQSLVKSPSYGIFFVMRVMQSLFQVCSHDLSLATSDFKNNPEKILGKESQNIISNSNSVIFRMMRYEYESNICTWYLTDFANKPRIISDHDPRYDGMNSYN